MFSVPCQPLHGFFIGNDMANLIDGLNAELIRNREILKIYEGIPERRFGAVMIKQSIKMAEKAIAEGDIVAMVRACKELQSTK